MHYKPVTLGNWLLFAIFCIIMAINFYLIIKYWIKQNDNDKNYYRPR